jgi:hypothetical protein
MTSYITINNSEIDPDSPITADLMTKMRDNPLAIGEGATGAPRIIGQSMARYGNGLPVMTITAANTYTLQYGQLQVTGALTTNSTTEVAAVTFTMKHYTGTVRCNASHACTGSSVVSTLSLYKNNILVTSFTTTSATPVARSVDVTFVANDILEWRHKNSTGGITNPSTVSAVSNLASDAFVPQYPLIPASLAS